MRSVIGVLSARLGQDRWIPTLFVLFFVGLALLEARFIYLAVSTYRGLVTEQPYERGLHYDQILAEERAQRERGWVATLAFAGPAGVPSPVELRLTDRDGAPILGAAVRIIAERTTRQAQAIPVELAEGSAGVYAGHLRLPVGGPWTLRAIIRKGDDVHRHIVQLRVPGSAQP